MITIMSVSIILNLFLIFTGFYVYRYLKKHKTPTYEELAKEYKKLQADKDILFKENYHVRQKLAYKKQILDSQINKEIEREKLFKKATSPATSVLR